MTDLQEMKKAPAAKENKNYSPWQSKAQVYRLPEQ